ncbi:hypothetical protein [Heyndrickxia camelliae]|uniref:Uncharacterized protein n=1 Tax=Heyndrickxia camelliae TaxID=1707093 RepID=A0A2N3LNC1_9BACI|nr:hypothetical protein [Heyndrickxia camelliae]PKR86075.1 hypothetical protein CWO92_06805 [Heyndrickxia camelliae]
MSIIYNFNTWKVSGNKAPQWSQKAYKLMRVNINKRGYTGELLGAIMYLHFIKGMTVTQIRKAPTGYNLPSVHIRSIIKGTFSPDAFIIFMDMLETEPEILDRLFRTY